MCLADPVKGHAELVDEADYLVLQFLLMLTERSELSQDPGDLLVGRLISALMLLFAHSREQRNTYGSVTAHYP